LKTDDALPYWAVGTVHLAPEETPAFVSDEWNYSPELSVLLDNEGNPQAVVIEWYLYGIIAGPPEYRLSIKPWCHAEAKPGVYTFHLYK
jgi:hypothetical protein